MRTHMTQTLYIRLTETLNFTKEKNTGQTKKETILRDIINETLHELKTKQTLLYMCAKKKKSWNTPKQNANTNYTKAVYDLVQTTIITLISKQKALVMDCKQADGTFQSNAELDALIEVLSAIHDTYQNETNPPVNPQLYESKELRAYKRTHTTYTHIDSKPNEDDWFENLMTTPNIHPFREVTTPTATSYRVTDNTAKQFFAETTPVYTQLDQLTIKNTTDAMRYFILIARVAYVFNVPMKTDLAEVEAYIINEFMRKDIRTDMLQKLMYTELNAVCKAFLQTKTNM